MFKEGFHLVVVRHGHLHLHASGLQVSRMIRRTSSLRNRIPQLVDGIRLVSTDVEYLVPGLGHQGPARDDGRDVVYVAERAYLPAIAEHRHWQASENLVEKYSDNIPVLVEHVLIRPVHVVRAEDHKIDTKQLLGSMQIQLEGILCNAIRVLWRRLILLGKTPRFVSGLRLRARSNQGPVRILHLRQIIDAAIHSNRRCKHKATDLVLYGLVQHLHGSNQIGSVIEGPNEVRKALSSVSSQVVNIIEHVLLEQCVKHQSILDVPLNKQRALRDVRLEASGEVVERNHSHTQIQTVPHHMAADKTRGTCHQRCLAFCLLALGCWKVRWGTCHPDDGCKRRSDCKSQHGVCHGGDRVCSRARG
mmetsp:Transcript_158348/g.507862  ORF Transcript_158348/g.507862 Transcript_158348/m.507862 type:complete len:361 (-) Transcript_158348:44-1126(-)